MTQDSKIQKALDMIDNYDWFWSMSDAWRYDSARVGMRRFVTLVNTIEDEGVRKALRGLWTLRYEETSSIIRMKSSFFFSTMPFLIKFITSFSAFVFEVSPVDLKFSMSSVL